MKAYKIAYDLLTNNFVINRKMQIFQKFY